MKKITAALEKGGIEKYTIFKLDKPFPFYLLDLKKLGISLPCAPYFKYITMEFWRPIYCINFYDEEEMFVARVNNGFTENPYITSDERDWFYSLRIPVSI